MTKIEKNSNVLTQSLLRSPIQSRGLRPEMKLLALVVLFKVDPEASESLLSLAAQCSPSPPHLMVWDNSPEPCSIAGRKWLDKTFASYDYHHCPENAPLSRIYNEVIDTWIIRRPGDFSHLLLLDQDSILEPDFLHIAAEAIDKHPDIGLFLPLVKSGGHTVSPAHLFYFKGVYWHRPRLGPIRLRFKTAINSGMIIASRYLLKKFPGYPDTLAFYGTDNWFCEQYAGDEGIACLFESTIHHNLSTYNIEDVEVKLWRHRETVRAARVLNSHGVFRRCGCYLYISLTCAQMALRFRDRRFLSC
jgi:GT2 family glycosyltransferase